MNNIFEEIKQIPITDILNKVGIKYKKVMWTLNLYDDWKITDGWKANINENFITDFTWKRAQWDQLAFIEKYLNLSKHEAIEWFKNNFWVIDNYKQIKKEIETPKIDVKSIFRSYKDLWEKQIEYLKSRWIDFEKVKDVVKQNNSWIACMLFNERWQAISINTRAINKKEFRILAWTQSKWVYMWKINRDIKKVYVVEWMFDFLSLYQFWINVIWLKSINDWIDVIREFYIKGYEIVLIPDNDEVWKTLLEKVKDIKYSLFDLEKYEVKDINDFLLESWFWEWIIEIIEEEKIKEKLNIELAFDKLKKIQELYKIRWKRWLDWPLKEIDKYTQWIIEGTVYTIWAFSNTWKSQLAYEYASYFIRQWKKVLFISTEVWVGDLLVFIARNYYRKDYFNLLSWKESINIKDFQNLYLYDNIKDFTKIKEKVEELKPDYVFIDFIQSIKHIWATEYERLSNIAVDMQELAIQKSITIFSLSQVNNNSRDTDWSDITLKWSWWLFSSSDVILWLYRDNWQLKLSIAKNKFWKARISFDMHIDFINWNITIFDDNEEDEIKI